MLATPVPAEQVGVFHTAYNVVAPVNVPLVVYDADVAELDVDHPINTCLSLAIVADELYDGKVQL